MKQDLARYILELCKKRGADDVIVQYNDGDNSHIKFVNNKISATKMWNLDSLNVYIAKDQRVVSSSLKTFSKAAAKELVTKMMQSVKMVPKNPNYQGIAKGPFKYKTVKESYDPTVQEMGKELIEITKQGVDIVKQKAKRASGVLENGSGYSYIITSNDVEAEDKYSSLYYSVRALANKNASGHTVTVSRMKNKFDYEKAAQQAAEIAKQAKLPRQNLSGKYDVIFSPHAFANILEQVGHSASIFSVEAGLSCLKGQLGKKVANEQVNFIDDGTRPNGYGSTSFDEEGHPTQKNVLIKNGVLQTFLHNTSTAKRYNTKSTGSAGLVSPHPHNLCLEPGDYSKDELFSSIKKGVYITNVWYTRFNNHATGEFSTIPRDGAFYVEKGEIKHALKNIRVSEIMPRMMKNVSRIGKEVEQIKSWEVETPTITPYVVVKDVNLSKPI